MLGKRYRHVLVGVIGAVGAMFSDIDVEDVDAETTNSWVFNNDGPWEMNSRWFLGTRPSLSDAADLITNPATKTVTLASSANINSLTVSNLTVRGFGASTNTLLLTTTNTVVVLNNLIVDTNAVLSISNSNLRVDGQLGGNFLIDGSVVFQRGSVVTTSNVTTTVIGDNTGGSLAMSGGTMSNWDLVVGNSAGASGTMTLAGGTNIVAGAFTAGKSAGATGTVYVTGDLMVMTNAPTLIGSNGVAQVSVTNGMVLCRDLIIGNNPGAVGTLTIVGGTNALSSSLQIGFSAGATGMVWVSGGSLDVTNASATASLVVGKGGRGSFTLSNGTVTVDQLLVTNGADSVMNLRGGTLTTRSTLVSNGSTFAVGSIATPAVLNLQGGSHYFRDGLKTTSPAGATSLVWMSASDLTMSNQGLQVAESGRGQMVVSNGVVTCGSMFVANGVGSQGTLTIAGGTNIITTGFDVGFSNASTGTVWITSGRLQVNINANLGHGGAGQMIISNGTLRANIVTLADFAGGSGTLTAAGGDSSILTRLELGTFNCTATGTVVVTGGSFFVTNASHTAALDVHTGSLILNSGALTIDQLVITNACGHFIRTGGTLSITSTNLGAGLDADGDGLPNDWEQTFGLNPLDSTGNHGASGDLDGDGFTNLQEFNAGTNPNNAGSFPTQAIWTSSASGKWEVGANWFLTLPPTNNQSVLITNTATKVVTIDTTTTNTPTTLVISNLTITAPVGATNTLSLTNTGVATPLRILNAATINSGGALLVMTNSRVRVEGGPLVVSADAANASVSVLRSGVVAVAGPMTVGGVGGSTGTVLVAEGLLAVTNNPALVGAGSGFVIDGSVALTNGSSIIATNVTTIIGNRGSGSLTMSGGSMSLATLNLGMNAGAQGTLTMAGGTNQVTGNLNIYSAAAVWITDSTALLVSTNQLMGISGQFTVSNGTAVSRSMEVGAGVLLVVDGTNRVSELLSVGGDSATSGAVYVTGNAGQLVTTSAVTQIALGLTSAGQITVSNGQWLAGEVRAASFDLEDCGAGTMTFAGGTTRLTSGLYLGGGTNWFEPGVTLGTGTVWVTGGQLITSNSFNYIGYYDVGRLTVSNGSWWGRLVIVGNATSAQGTLTVAGGTATVDYQFHIGGYYASASARGTGTLWLTGGQLITTNATTVVGSLGVGCMTISNGTWSGGDVGVGFYEQGTLTVGGGTNTLSALYVGLNANGVVWLTGGQLTVTNGETFIGGQSYGGTGRMTVSNGTWLVRGVDVGAGTSAAGTLTIAGGTSSVYSNLTIGNFPCTPTGTVVVASGGLFVTNGLGTATLEVRSGTLTQSGGTLVIDQLVITNSCGRFVHYGGTLLVGNTNNVLPDLDADGDGLPNSFEQTYGLDPFNDTGNDGPSGDPDGDGFTNLQESQAGTDPNDNASVFRITGIAQQNSTNILVTWTMGLGKTNILERVASGMGSYTDDFFFTVFIVTNTVGTSTNYLDVGASATAHGRYYRVRLAP